MWWVATFRYDKDKTGAIPTKRMYSILDLKLDGDPWDRTLPVGTQDHYRQSTPYYKTIKQGKVHASPAAVPSALDDGVRGEAIKTPSSPSKSPTHQVLEKDTAGEWYVDNICWFYFFWKFGEEYIDKLMRCWKSGEQIIGKGGEAVRSWYCRCYVYMKFLNWWLFRTFWLYCCLATFLLLKICMTAQPCIAVLFPWYSYYNFRPLMLSERIAFPLNLLVIVACSLRQLQCTVACHHFAMLQLVTARYTQRWLQKINMFCVWAELSTLSANM